METGGIVENSFKKILSNFDVIIEIGPCDYFLYDLLVTGKKSDAKVICYDNDKKEIPNYINIIDFRVGNCFKNNTAEEVKKIINSTSGPVLLLCDGKNKIQEFYYYSTFLKKGDVIMCHDYAHTREEFDNLKKQFDSNLRYDSWWELLEPVTKKRNLRQYYYDDFKNILWGSFIKD
jgi:hypothetical protein